LENLEKIAKARGLGLWANKNIVLPDELQPIKIQKNVSGIVTSVYDGDTMTLETNLREKFTVRFYGIDCPERNQASGLEARDFSRSLILRKSVNVQVIDIDRYGRYVGLIRTESGLLVNTELIKNGWAWHYKAYSKFPEWQLFEDEARGKKVGMWGLANVPQAPWEYRRTNMKNSQFSGNSEFSITNPDIELFQGKTLIRINFLLYKNLLIFFKKLIRSCYICT
jgi:endonuclease YncB( thermonuclease family)